MTATMPQITCDECGRDITTTIAEGRQAMSATVERRYALTRLSAGDYLLPSNDGTTLYRLQRYMDGPSCGIMGWPRDRWMWRVFRWCKPLPCDDIDLGEYFDGWREVSVMHDTRREAIDSALGAES